MSARDAGLKALYYAGIVLVALPFMQGKTYLIPLLLLAVAGANHLIGIFSRSRSVRQAGVRTNLFMWRHKTLLRIALVAFLVILPFLSSNYIVDVLTSAILYAILASALNITVGFTGVLVLGFIAFYAIGAYTTALLTAKYQLMGFWGALPCAGVAAMFCGLLLGIPALRLKGDYLAIVTLGFGEIVKILLNNLDTITGGPNGILGIKRPELPFVSLSSITSYYYFCLVVLLIILIIIARITRSRYGRAWIAIRENELAAHASGIDIFGKYLLSFSMSAFLGGIAGALFASKQGFISPESFNFYESVLVLCMVVLGGIGNMAGSLVGAFLLVVVPEFLREFQSYRMLIFGAVMITFMIFRPHGLVGSRTIAREFREHGDGSE